MLLARSRRSALLCALLFVTASLGAHVHRALQPHGFCPKHGERIHLTHEELGERPVYPSSRMESREDHHHTHFCAQLEFLAQCSESPSSALQVAGDCTAPARALSLTETSPLPSIPLILQAPKSSPPSRIG